MNNRNWGERPPVTRQQREKIVRLLRQDPEELPMRTIARALGIGYSTVRHINYEEGIRLKPEPDAHVA